MVSLSTSIGIYTKPILIFTLAWTILTKPKPIEGVVKIGDGDASSLSEVSAQSGHHTAAITAIPVKTITE